ncbi:MAG TPA: hypothetical protein VMI06_06360, partial [Terriglobia bacterium]|nr:hypothetical protein [Terriglobia bacterium]
STSDYDVVARLEPEHFAELPTHHPRVGSNPADPDLKADPTRGPARLVQIQTAAPTLEVYALPHL